MNTKENYPVLSEFHAAMAEYYSPKIRAFTTKGQRPFVMSVGFSSNHEKLFMKFMTWVVNGRIKGDMPQLPKVLTVSESFEILDQGGSWPNLSDEFDLDVLCFGLKILYVPQFNEESGWFAGEIRIEGSSHDIRPELQKNNPDAYEDICRAVQEEMKERKESA